MSAYRPYPKYKPSGVEWLGEVPEGWVVKPLKVVASFNDDVLSESFSEDEEIEYVDIGSVSLETGIERTETFRFGDAPSRARRRVRDGDVIASTVRTYLKAIAPVVAPPANLIVSTGFAVIRPQNGLDSHFAKFSLQSSYFVDEVISRSTGVSYPAINASEMAAISLPLPPLPEQIQIAAFLDRECGKLDALQAKQQRLIELLKEKRQALISHAVTRGLDPTAKLKPSGIEWLGDVPEHWMVKKLGLIATFKGGAGFPDDYQGQTENEIPFFKVGDIVNSDSMGVMRQANHTITRETAKLLRAFIFPSGTVLFAKVGAALLLKRFRTLGQSSCIDNNMMGMFAGKDTLADFLIYVLPLLDFELIVNPGAVPSINEGQISGQRIALPPLAEQRAIVAHLDDKCGKIDQLKAKAERGIELLKERRSALISAAVTGKIDVRDV